MPTQESADSTRPKSEAIFHPDGEGASERSEVFVPTPLATGPWRAGTQHGGPMLGLLARAVERHPAERPVQVTRLTVDLMRAAPMNRVETVCRTIRAGKNVEVVEALLLADGEEYARATAMRFRIAGVEGSRDEKVDVEPSPTAWDSLALPEGGSRPVWGEHGAGEAFHQATEMRPVMGLEMPALWMRLCVPMVKGEETSPLVTVAAISDSVYSVPFIAKVMANPRALREQRNISINPDTTLNLHRPLEGEWLCLQGWSHFDESGAGTAFARLSDQRGPIGTASQSILVRGPENRPESWRGYDKLIEDNHKSKSRNQG